MEWSLAREELEKMEEGAGFVFSRTMECVLVALSADQHGQILTDLPSYSLLFSTPIFCILKLMRFDFYGFQALFAFSF